jgi:hypothetical protein
MICANCSANAEYTYRINTSLAFNYCNKHLPKFLTGQRTAGHLKLEVPVVEAPKPVKKKAEVVEEPVVEVPVEEIVEDDASN